MSTPLSLTAKKWPESRWRSDGPYGFLDAEEDLVHFNSKPWWMRRLPAVRHECFVFTYAYFDDVGVSAGRAPLAPYSMTVDRCSCGAWSLNDGPWEGVNSRRGA